MEHIASDEVEQEVLMDYLLPAALLVLTFVVLYLRRKSPDETAKIAREFVEHQKPALALFVVFLDIIRRIVAVAVLVGAMSLLSRIPNVEQKIAQIGTWIVGNGRWMFPLGICLIPGLYAMRKTIRWLYGAIEVVIGIVALAVFHQLPAGDLAGWVIGYAAPIYIAIRGLDNFDRGISDPWRRRLWWLGKKPSG